MEDGDYLGAYERFFNEFVKRINPNDQLPVKMSGHEINGEEVIGELIDLSLQYLNQKYCPPSLQSFIVCLVIEEMKPIFKHQPEICGLRPEKNTYAPLKLMQAVTKKINEICHRYLENSRLALLPPPPSTPFPMTSVFAIKNNRRKMEDRHVVLHDLNTMFKIDDDYPASYYAVFDGHAGQDAAVYCATHLHQYLAESIYYPSNIEHALRDAFITTDAHFIQKCKKHALSSGTTAVCAVISNKKFYVAWVGDSQAVLVKRNNVEQLVNSHRPDRSDEKQRIEEMGGLVLHYGMWRVNGDLAVSRAIGDPKYKPYVTSEPEMCSGDLDGSEDFLIIACDGLWDYVNEVTAAKLVYEQISRDCHNIEAISHYLGEYSKNQGSSDNITVIIVFLTPPNQIVKKQLDAHSLSTDVNTINMEVNNRHMSDPNSQCDVDTEFMEQQFYNKNDSSFDDNASYEKPSTISQDGRTLEYEDGKNDDLGPETNVDTLDDASDNCTLVNASRELFSNEKSDNNLTVENERGDTFLCPSNNTNERHNITSVDNVGDSDESDDEWNFYRIEPNQETENSLQPKVSSVVSEVGEEIVEPEILENYKDLLISDEKLNLCNQNPEKSEEKESFFSPDKSEINENNEDLLLPEAQDNCSEEMDFSLNPNAAEFVPVSSPPSIPSRFMDLPISGSPLKQTSMMDDINLPSPKEFKEEASHRPHEVEEEDNETISLNGNAFTGENIEEFDGKKKAALNLDESEISSTRAEFGDESNISFLATDFQKASGFDGSFTESCTEYENDPMAMSMGPDGFNLLSNPVDLNAIHDLNDSDLCDINSLGEEKEQTLTPVDDDHSQPLDLKSPDSNELQLKSTPLEHENTNNNIMCTLSPSEELNVKNIENNTDEIISQVVAMNLKNEQLSEVCLENTNDFMNNTDNIKNNDQTQDNSLLTEQKPSESLFLESQHVPLENVEIQTPQNKFDSSLENCLISCDESENLEHHQEIILTDQCNENTFSDSEKLTSHDSINTQAITKSEPTFNNECEFKNEEQKKNEEKDNVPDVSVSDNFTNVLVDIVPTKAQNGENSIIEKENTDITVSPRKSMELSKSLQEFTGLEKELSPTENNKDLMESISHEISEKSQIQDALTTKDVVVENSEKSLDQTTEPSPEKIKVSAVEAKTTTAVATKKNSSKISSKTITKTSGTKSSTRVTPAALSKPLVGVVSRSTNSSADAKKVIGVGVAGNSVDVSKASTLNKPSSKPGVKSAPRLTSVSQSKSSATKVPLTTTNTEKKSTVTTNGDSKANKIPPKSRTSTVDVPSKPLVKSTVSSTRLTITTKSKSSVGTTESKPGLKTTAEVKSSGINVRPRTAPSALTTTKSRTSNPVKPSIVDKNVKETANKQILNRTTSTTNSRASNQGLQSTTTTASATTKRSTTTVRTTKQQSSLTRTTAKNIKTSIKTNVNKTQLPNNVNEIKNAKVIEESLSAVTIANTENVSEKDSTTPTIENQQIIGQEL